MVLNALPKEMGEQPCPRSREIESLFAEGDLKAKVVIQEYCAERIDAWLRDRFGAALSSVDRDEILSTAIDRAWTSRHSYDAKKGEFYTWFRILSRWVALDCLRRKKAKELEARNGIVVREDERASHSDQIDWARMRAKLRDSLERLNDFDRDLLIWYLANKDDDHWAVDAAGPFDSKPEALRLKVHRMLKRLKRELAA